MESQMDNKSKDPIGSRQKHEFLAIMDSLFPDQDLLNENSKYRKKADLAFELMLKLEWSVNEFQNTMSEFSLKWIYYSWMPAHLIELKNKLFPNNEMII
jgi:hypothetical protein